MLLTLESGTSNLVVKCVDLNPNGLTCPEPVSVFFWLCSTSNVSCRPHSASSTGVNITVIHNRDSCRSLLLPLRLTTLLLLLHCPPFPLVVQLFVLCLQFLLPLFTLGTTASSPIEQCQHNPESILVAEQRVAGLTLIPRRSSARGLSRHRSWTGGRASGTSSSGRSRRIQGTRTLWTCRCLSASDGVSSSVVPWRSAGLGNPSWR